MKSATLYVLGVCLVLSVGAYADEMTQVQAIEDGWDGVRSQGGVEALVDYNMEEETSVISHQSYP